MRTEWGSTKRPACDVSIVLPIFDEAETIAALLGSIFAVLKQTGKTFEVIAINDGSLDESLRLLRDEATARPNLRVIDFRRNFGQTAALMAGIDHAAGDVIVSLDADLQNDPEDIPVLLEKLAEGYDVVSGWRQHRQDGPFRGFLSRMANRVISRLSGVRLKDYGCTLKAYRREVVSGIRLYGEMHRFIPIYASGMGAKLAEVAVRHHPRRFGRSKYGFERIVKVLLDLLVVRFLDTYLVKPVYIFGGFGVVSLVLSLFAFAYMIHLKLDKGVSMILTPLPTLVAITFLVGCMSILLGLLAEIVVRTYFESQGQTAYKVRELVNFDSAPDVRS
jgi:glycosyltransferase involved in cell wall biosynthesis